MKHIVISGSTAYDSLLTISENFSDFFQKQEFQSFSLITQESEKFHGGTGANIIYNLSLLWEAAILLSSIGWNYIFSDFIEEKAILKYVHRERYAQTASSVIIADNTDNRMTFFSENAMRFAWNAKPEYITESIWIALISANHIPTMLEHAAYFYKKCIPVILDPAQQISQMTEQELQEFLSHGTILIVNHYEFQEIMMKTAFSAEEIYEKFENVIITYGENGSHIFSKKEWNFQISAIKVDDFADTTGAGDAYRAALCLGIIEDWDIKTSCKLGTILASYSILTKGAQNHHVSLGNLMLDMEELYGIKMDLYQRRKY